eukprot:10216131-Prorocentrum_lima.AAC.1
MLDPYEIEAALLDYAGESRLATTSIGSAAEEPDVDINYDSLYWQAHSHVVQMKIRVFERYRRALN